MFLFAVFAAFHIDYSARIGRSSEEKENIFTMQIRGKWKVWEACGEGRRSARVLHCTRERAQEGGNENHCTTRLNNPQRDSESGLFTVSVLRHFSHSADLPFTHFRRSIFTLPVSTTFIYRLALEPFKIDFQIYYWIKTRF